MKKTAKTGATVAIQHQENPIEILRLSIESAAQSAEWVSWKTALEEFFDCIDGRNKKHIVGTPGGSMGFMVELTATLEEMHGESLHRPQIEGIVAGISRITTLSLHGSEHALELLQKALLKDERFRKYSTVISEDVLDFVLHGGNLETEEEHDALILYLEEYAGCGHFERMMKESEDYNIRPELAREVHRAFWRGKWGLLEEANADNFTFQSLEGYHEEQAVALVSLFAAGDANLNYPELPEDDNFMIPAFQPWKDMQVFVVHPQMAVVWRKMAAEFLKAHWGLLKTKEEGAEFQLIMSQRWKKFLQITAGKLKATEKPFFDVVYQPDGQVTVTERK